MCVKQMLRFQRYASAERASRRLCVKSDERFAYAFATVCASKRDAIDCALQNADRAQDIEAGLARASTNIALGRQVAVVEARTDFARFTAQLDSQTDALSRHVALLDDLDPKERARLHVQQELDASMRELTDLPNSLPTSAPAGVRDAIAETRAAAHATAAAKNAAIDRSGITELERITNTIGPSLSGAIAQAGQDGFKSWESAAQQSASQLQGQLLNAVASAALFNILGGATGGGGALLGSGFIPLFGDGGIVTRPTLAIVGEKGPRGDPAAEQAFAGWRWW